jgi:hypothetical protein
MMRMDDDSSDGGDTVGSSSFGVPEQVADFAAAECDGGHNCAGEAGRETSGRRDWQWDRL